MRELKNMFLTSSCSAVFMTVDSLGDDWRERRAQVAKKGGDVMVKH